MTNLDTEAKRRVGLVVVLHIYSISKNNGYNIQISLTGRKSRPEPFPQNKCSSLCVLEYQSSMYIILIVYNKNLNNYQTTL